MRGIRVHSAPSGGALSRLRLLLLFLLVLLAPPTLRARAADPTNAVIHAVHAPGATTAFDPKPDVVRRMVDRGIRDLGGSENLTNAWRRFIKPNDVVGFRVLSAPGPVAGTRPAVVDALAQSLLSIGHKPDRIVVWDRRASDLVLAGYTRLAARLGIRCVATEEAGWDETHYYSNATIGRLIVGDLEFPKRFERDVGKKSHISTLLTRDVTRIIPVTPVASHNQTGVSGQLSALSLGAVDNTLRFENDLHVQAEVLPEIVALDDIFPKLAFGVSDALICQYRGEERTLLHYAVALDELRFSTDPVALDVQALADIEAGRKANPIDGERPFVSDLYKNAALLEIGVSIRSLIQTKRSSLAAP